MLKEETITYTADGMVQKNFLVYDRRTNEKSPSILIIHEWWGLNEFIRNKARQIAKYGYNVMAVDIFGNGRTASTPDEAMLLVRPFLDNPELTKIHIVSAINRMRAFPQSDPDNIGALGYSFGGWVVLNASKLGANLKGVVSVSGELSGVPVNKTLLRAKILVCHGEEDTLVPPGGMENFRKQLDAAGADYSVNIYPGAINSFSNPDSTRLGKEFNMDMAYNQEADEKSWNDIISFFEILFGRIEPLGN